MGGPRKSRKSHILTATKEPANSKSKSKLQQSRRKESYLNLKENIKAFLAVLIKIP
jgi:hypothetical protein